ncbi:MAG: hypothetical protein AB1651_16825 [Pseudomonadota bacterium]|jgi:uncharacterized membrane protein SpoIIM required for sporulation
MNAAMLFASTFAVVFCLGAQSLLVNNGRYVAAFINSLAIGAAHLALYKLAPDATGAEIVAYLFGGPIGIVSAMYVFRRLHRRS